MTNYIDGVVVGKCGLCGGAVVSPRLWSGVGRVPKTCEKCGAVADELHGQPVLPMKPRSLAPRMQEIAPAYTDSGGFNQLKAEYESFWRGDGWRRS